MRKTRMHPIVFMLKGLMHYSIPSCMYPRRTVYLRSASDTGNLAMRI